MAEEAIEYACQKAGLKFKLKKEQKQCILDIISEKDVFALLPTGFGKTTIYALLPFVYEKLGVRDAIILIISPLISLMKDQVVNMEKYQIKSAYVGDATVEDMKDLEAGLVPLVLMSPESLFNGKWRDTFSSTIYNEKLKVIVVDEAHCVLAWGEEFRKDYGKVGELRSLLPKAALLALTATASPKSRQLITNSLLMENTTYIISSADRPNIFYSVNKVTKDIKESMLWLMNDLKENSKRTPKTIVYCPTIKTCSSLYGLFRQTLGQEFSYEGTTAMKNCLYGMYHHSTTDRCKQNITETFPKEESTTRVIFATSAFGMGVNIPDVERVIHFGAPRTLQGFMQESGRGGRNGCKCDSMLYTLPADTTHSDQETKEFIKAETCRRQYLINIFTPEKPVRKIPGHLCCDNCRKECECSDCASVQNDTSLTEQLASFSLEDYSFDKEMSVRTVSTHQRQILKTQLTEYRQELIDLSNSSMIHPDIFTGLSDQVIEQVVNNVHCIETMDDILDVYIFNKTVATKVLSIIDSCT